VLLDGRLDLAHRHALSHQLEVRVVADQDAKSDGHQILELR
jgi:hypothetical protein